MPSLFDRNPDLELKGVCVLSYLSTGILGLIYVLFGGKHRNSMFFKFHFYQSMLLGITWMLLNMGAGGLISTITGLLGLFGSATGSITAAVGMGLGLAVEGVSIVIRLCLLAGIIQSLRGRYLDLPGISKMVRSRM